MSELPSSRDFNWDEYFARTQTLPELSKIKAFVDHLPAKPRILDYGCGTGRFSAAFAKVIEDATIDVIDQHLDKSIHISENWRGTRYQHRLEEFVPEFSYDGIWAHAILFLLPKPELKQQFSLLANALKTKGVFEFNLVENGDGATRAHFTGLDIESIHEMLRENKLAAISFQKEENARYGKHKEIIPTYNVIAIKQP